MSIFFDSIIIFYLIASTTFAVSIFRDRKRIGSWESRHRAITFIVFMLLCSSILIMIWGSFIEPRLITVNHVAIDLPNFEPTQPVKTVLISDAHVGTYKKEGWIKKISSRITELNPDLVLIAGDLIVNKAEQVKYLSGFEQLSSKVPVYAVLGDHDYMVKLKPQFSIDEEIAKAVRYTLLTAGVKTLTNQAEPITNYGATFVLVGLDEWLAKKTDMQSALPDIANINPNNLPPATPVVALIHNPDFTLSEESKKVDLVLAGHTHGGQIRLPWLGPVPALPTKLPRSFDQGLFDLNQYTEIQSPNIRRLDLRISQLFITSGISESGPRARLFNPPEIVLIELY